MDRQEETELLLKQKYNFHFSDDASKKYRFHGRELLQRDRLPELLNLVGAHLQSPNLTVTASLFAKYYSYFVMAGGLFATVHRNQHLDLSLDSTSLHTNEDWSPSLVLRETRLHGSHESMDSLFDGHLRPLFRFLSEIGHIQESVLWAHAAYGVHYIFEQWMKEASTLEKKTQMERVFSSLLSTIPEVQIEFEVIDHPLFHGEKLRIRKKCCLRYCLPGASNCTTCPMLSVEERAARLQAYHGIC